MIYDFSPWTIDIFPAKHIAIVPFLCFHIIGIQLIVVDEILDHHRLIDVVVFRRRKAIVRHADGQGQLRRTLLFAESARLEPLICRLLCANRDHPTIAHLFGTGDSSILAERRNSPLCYIPAYCCFSY